MTIDEALAIYDDAVLWGTGSWDDAVEVLAQAAREYREIKRYSINVSELQMTTGPPITK